MDDKRPEDGCAAACNVRSAAFAMEQMRESRMGSSELQRAKFDLCSVYLLNLHVYLALDERERDDHPVRNVLEKIEQVFKRMAGDKRPGDTPAEERKGRLITRDMAKNRCKKKRRTRDSANPLLKNREKARKLFERAKQTFDGNIDARGSRSAKY